MTTAVPRQVPAEPAETRLRGAAQVVIEERHQRRVGDLGLGAHRGDRERENPHRSGATGKRRHSKVIARREAVRDPRSGAASRQAPRVVVS